MGIVFQLVILSRPNEQKKTIPIFYPLWRCLEVSFFSVLNSCRQCCKVAAARLGWHGLGLAGMALGWLALGCGWLGWPGLGKAGWLARAGWPWDTSLGSVGYVGWVGSLAWAGVGWTGWDMVSLRSFMYARSLHTDPEYL